MCHGKMENFADVATLEGVWFSDQCEQWHITPPPIITMCHCLFLFLFLLVVHEGNGKIFWKCEEEECLLPERGEKVWQSEVSEKLVCRKHQVLLCDVVLCECMTCKSGLHQGVRCCFTIYTAITGWRGAPSAPASHRVFCRFFYFNKFEAEHFLLHINYGEEPRRSWRIIIVFKCELTCWTVKEQIRTYSLTCIKQSQ